MRQIEIFLHCDWEGCTCRTLEGNDSPDAVGEVTLAFNGSKPRQFQICGTHRAALDDVIVPLMQAGVTVDQPKAKGGNAAATAAASQGAYECKVPDCGRTLKGRAGMAQHVIRSHGFADLAAYEAEYHTHID